MRDRERERGLSVRECNRRIWLLWDVVLIMTLHLMLSLRLEPFCLIPIHDFSVTFFLCSGCECSKSRKASLKLYYKIHRNLSIIAVCGSIQSFHMWIIIIQHTQVVVKPSTVFTSISMIFQCFNPFQSIYCSLQRTSVRGTTASQGFSTWLSWRRGRLAWALAWLATVTAPAWACLWSGSTPVEPPAKTVALWSGMNCWRWGACISNLVVTYALDWCSLTRSWCPVVITVLYGLNQTNMTWFRFSSLIWDLRWVLVSTILSEVCRKQANVMTVAELNSIASNSIE